MASILKLRRGTTAQNDSFTGANGEISFDFERKELRVHDGITAGGFTIQNANTAGGINSFDWYSANNTLVITTPAGTTFEADIGSITSYIDTEIANLVDSAPGTLDTLNEIAAAIGDNADFATYVDTNLDQRLGATASVTLTGDIAGSGSFSSNAISITTELSDTGTPTGTFGSATQIPVVTVDVDGRITNISNTTVAGVSTFSYTGANTTFTIGTADGSSFTASLDVANTSTAGVAKFDANNFTVDAEGLVRSTTFDYRSSTVTAFPEGDYQGDDAYVGITDTIDAFGVTVAPLFDCMDPVGRTVTEDLGQM